MGVARSRDLSGCGYLLMFSFLHDSSCVHLLFHMHSFSDAISFARARNFDGFLAVGGGSVMDTAKAANLYLCCPENDLLDFMNAPIGKGMPVTKTLKPLICGKSFYWCDIGLHHDDIIFYYIMMTSSFITS